MMLITTKMISLLITIFLTNGDKISGQFIEESEKSVTIENIYFGKMDIDKTMILSFEKQVDSDTNKKPVETKNKPEDSRIKGSIKWNNKISANFGVIGGNSELLSIGGSVSINRNKLWVNEWNFFTKFDYRTNKGEKSYQQFNGFIRYGHSLTKKFYGFVSVELANDYSTKLDLKVAPTLGIGYWIFDIPKKLNLMAELSGGYSQSYYIDPREEGMPILVLRGIFNWKILPTLTLAEDFKITPNILDFSNINIDNNISLSTSLTKKLFLKLAYNLSYNSAPSPDVKNLDHSFVSSIEWKF